MDYVVALGAAALAMVGNGTAVILEKVGIDEQEAPRRRRRRWLPLRIATDRAYLAGIGLNIISWLLTLVALRTLPLFLVQSVIAANIIITALLDQLLLKRRLPRRGYWLIGLILLGLCLLAATAPPQVIDHVVTGDYFVVGCLVLAGVSACGLLALQLGRRWSAALLSVTAGLAFAAVSVAGRLITGSLSLAQFFTAPLAYLLVAGSFVGLVWFTLALGRSSATLVNAITLSVQTVTPAVIGLVLLGDRVRSGTGLLMILALTITLGASLALGALRNR